MFVTKDQIKMLLQTIKYLHLETNDENKPVEVSLYDYDDNFFISLNIYGLKHLLRMNKTVFAFNNPSILDSTTDLISGVYEGGFKVWECSEDLLQYLLSNDIIKPNQSVCDIGCGAGLLGILALKKKASLVHFLDFNKEVLHWFTLPNILNNVVIQTDTEDELLDCVLSKSSFYPGDWSDVDKELGSIQYDIILTSETIYKKDNYQKLLNLFKNHLNPIDGQVFVAAKVYYFGLDGGCFEFIEFIEKDGTFDIDVVETIYANLQRNILRLKFKELIRS